MDRPFRTRSIVHIGQSIQADVLLVDPLGQCGGQMVASCRFNAADQPALRGLRIGHAGAGWRYGREVWRVTSGVLSAARRGRRN